MLRRKTDDKVRMLAGVSLFEACRDSELAAIATATDLLAVPAGSVLCTQGSHGEEAFVIVSGQVDVRIDGDVVAVLGPGQTVGEMALLDREPRSATVVARDDLEVLVLGRRELFGVLEANPSVSRRLLAELSGRIRRAAVPA